MKTKEYIKKYELNVSDSFDHNMFIGDLAIDFIAENKNFFFDGNKVYWKSKL